MSTFFISIFFSFLTSFILFTFQAPHSKWNLFLAFYCFCFLLFRLLLTQNPDCPLASPLWPAGGGHGGILLDPSSAEDQPSSSKTLHEVGWYSSGLGVVVTFICSLKIFYICTTPSAQLPLSLTQSGTLQR